MKGISRFLFAVALATTVLAQGPWAKKDWRQWSKDDCKKVLEDSPWAQRWVQSNSKMGNFATRTEGTLGVGSESELSVFYFVQLRSARPIREAVVRQAFIASGYDKLEPPKQKEMEKQTEAFLNRTYDDVVVVHIIYGSNVQEYNRDLATYWQTQYPEGTVPQQAYLNGPKGQKIAPVRMVSPKGGAQEFELIFPRMVEGKPLLEPGDKAISVEFISPTVGNRTSTTNDARVPSGRVFTEFKVDKMTMNGQLVY